MPKQDLYNGLGSLMYAMAKSDGKCHSEEYKVVEEVFGLEPFGDVAYYSFQDKEAYRTDPDRAYAYALRRFQENSDAFEIQEKEEFVRILERVALAHNGISEKEEELLERVKYDLDRIMQPAVSN
jgi:uncharacterized tellurite resistance protein B-like protein